MGRKQTDRKVGNLYLGRHTLHVLHEYSPTTLLFARFEIASFVVCGLQYTWHARCHGLGRRWGRPMICVVPLLALPQAGNKQLLSRRIEHYLESVEVGGFETALLFREGNEWPCYAHVEYNII